MKKNSRLLNGLYLLLDLGGDLIAIIVAIILIIRYQTQPLKPDVSELVLGTLAITSLIAVSGLWDRLKRLRRIESLAEETKSLVETRVVNRIRADEFFQTHLSVNEAFFSNANSICISGITLGNTSSEFSYILGQRLLAGATIRIILIAPSTDVLKQIVLRSWGTTTTEYYKSRIETTASLIGIVANTPNATGSLHLGFLPYIPSFGITMTNSATEKGAALIEVYHHSSTEPSPSFLVTENQDPYWFRFFSTQFELMWKQCTVKKLLDKGTTTFEVSQ